MKNPSLSILLLLSIIASCSGPKTTTEEKRDSVSNTPIAPIDSSKIVPPTELSVWTIPYENQKNFLYIFPRTANGCDLFTGDFSDGPNYKTGVDEITAPITGHFSNTKTFDNHDCGSGDFINVDLDGGRGSGWMFANDVMVPDGADLGTFTLGKRTIKLSKMKTIQLKEDTECRSIVTWFFYDSKYLYLIDITGQEEQGQLFWDKDPYLSMVDQLPMGSVTSGVADNIITMQWGVPNGKVTIKFDFTSGHFKVNSYAMEAVEGE
jgi:hypothetical protein